MNYFYSHGLECFVYIKVLPSIVRRIFAGHLHRIFMA